MLSEQILIFFQIIFIDLVLAGDNAIIIGMVASQFPAEQRKKIIFWGIGAAVVLRILFTLITAYLLQISGLRLVGGILLLYICYKLYVDVVKQSEKKESNHNSHSSRYNYEFRQCFRSCWGRKRSLLLISFWACPINYINGNCSNINFWLDKKIQMDCLGRFTSSSNSCNRIDLY